MMKIKKISEEKFMANNDFLEEIKAEYERLNKEKNNVAKEKIKRK